MACFVGCASAGSLCPACGIGSVMARPGRPRERDRGASLPPGFGGQLQLSFTIRSSSMWPGQMASWPCMQPMPGMMFDQFGQLVAQSQHGARSQTVGHGLFSQAAAMTSPEMQHMANQQHLLQSQQCQFAAAMQQMPAVPLQQVPSPSMGHIPLALQGVQSSGVPPTQPPPIPAQATPAVTDPSGFHDDQPKLSTSYRVLGMVWKFGARASIPKKVRTSCVHACDPTEWTLLRLSLLGEDETDALVFLVSGIRPTTRVSDLNCRTKGALRTIVSTEARRVMKAQPERLVGLAHDLSNLFQEALRLGYKLRDFPPALASTLDPQGQQTPPQSQLVEVSAASLPSQEDTIRQQAAKRRRVLALGDEEDQGPHTATDSNEDPTPLIEIEPDSGRGKTSLVLDENGKEQPPEQKQPRSGVDLGAMDPKVLGQLQAFLQKEAEKRQGDLPSRIEILTNGNG